jgi:hypothetical protein
MVAFLECDRLLDDRLGGHGVEGSGEQACQEPGYQDSPEKRARPDLEARLQ